MKRTQNSAVACGNKQVWAALVGIKRGRVERHTAEIPLRDIKTDSV